VEWQGRQTLTKRLERWPQTDTCKTFIVSFALCFRTSGFSRGFTTVYRPTGNSAISRTQHSQFDIRELSSTPMH
jgi:hypothetical protein